MDSVLLVRSLGPARSTPPPLLACLLTHSSLVSFTLYSLPPHITSSLTQLTPYLLCHIPPPLSSSLSLMLSYHPHSVILPHTCDALHPNVTSRKDVAERGSVAEEDGDQGRPRDMQRREGSQAAGETSGSREDNEVTRGSQG